MTSPTVSIIIPTYNHGHFLATALQSVLAQTVTDWEAVVIDNFSTDNTVSVVESFADPRIRLVQFANQGVIAASRNYGIVCTSAPYIAFLDSDDCWYPEKLAITLQKLRDGNDLVCHGELWRGPNNRVRKVIYGPRERSSYQNLLLEGNCISTSAVVIDRMVLEKAGGFSERPEFVTAEDYDLWLKVACLGGRIDFVAEILGEYLIHGGNQSRASLKNMYAVMAVFEQHVAQQPAGRWPEQSLRHRRGGVYYSGARSLQSSGRFHDAFRCYWHALRLSPWSIRFYVAMLLNLFRIKM